MPYVKVNACVVLHGLTKKHQSEMPDFGFATYIQKLNSGSLCYIAPEVLLNQPCNEMVDIFSFGIIFWQLLTGEIPFGKEMSVDDYLKNVVNGGLRPTTNGIGLKPEIVSLIQLCWSADPLQRPNIATILQILNYLLSQSYKSKCNVLKTKYRNSSKQKFNIFNWKKKIFPICQDRIRSMSLQDDTVRVRLAVTYKNSYFL